MVWSELQRNRLSIEKNILEKHFPARVSWIDPRGKTKVLANLNSNSDKEYTLRIDIPPDFPNSCPDLLIVSPRNLVQKDGSLIPDSSTAFHTLIRIEGFQSICHFYPPQWTAQHTLYQVLMKGRLWIEAYEGHLKTGKNLDEFLGHQRFTMNESGSATANISTIYVTRSGVPPAAQEIGDMSDSESPPPRNNVFKRMGKKIKKKLGRRRSGCDSSDDSDDL